MSLSIADRRYARSANPSAQHACAEALHCAHCGQPLARRDSGVEAGRNVERLVIGASSDPDCVAQMADDVMCGPVSAPGRGSQSPGPNPWRTVPNRCRCSPNTSIRCRGSMSHARPVHSSNLPGRTETRSWLLVPMGSGQTRCPVESVMMCPDREAAEPGPGSVAWRICRIAPGPIRNPASLRWRASWRLFDAHDH